MENNEFIRTVAIFRFILPQALIRLAAGRAFLPDNGKAALLAGANAVISGDFLTTTGITFESDIQMIKEQGYKINQTF
jgi:biotin synthase